MEKNELDKRFLRRFITSGRAIMTVLSKKSKEHLTYTFIRRAEKIEVYVRHIRTLKEHLVGEITGDMLNLKKGEDPIPAELVCWVWRNLERQEVLEQAVFLHNGKCAHCGRTLTHPDSINKGIGPWCLKRMAELNM